MAIVELLTLSQKLCNGKIEKGSSSCTANSAIPNKNKDTMAEAGIKPNPGGTCSSDNKNKGVVVAVAVAAAAAEVDVVVAVVDSITVAAAVAASAKV